MGQMMDKFEELAGDAFSIGSIVVLAYFVFDKVIGKCTGPYSEYNPFCYLLPEKSDVVGPGPKPSTDTSGSGYKPTAAAIGPGSVPVVSGSDKTTVIAGSVGNLCRPRLAQSDWRDVSTKYSKVGEPFIFGEWNSLEFADASAPTNLKICEEEAFHCSYLCLRLFAAVGARDPSGSEHCLGALDTRVDYGAWTSVSGHELQENPMYRTCRYPDEPGYVAATPAFTTVVPGGVITSKYHTYRTYYQLGLAPVCKELPHLLWCTTLADSNDVRCRQCLTAYGGAFEDVWCFNHPSDPICSYLQSCPEETVSSCIRSGEYGSPICKPCFVIGG